MSNVRRRTAVTRSALLVTDHFEVPFRQPCWNANQLSHEDTGLRQTSTTAPRLLENTSSDSGADDVTHGSISCLLVNVQRERAEDRNTMSSR